MRTPDLLSLGAAVYACPLSDCLWTLSYPLITPFPLAVDQRVVGTALTPGPYQETARAHVETAINRLSRERSEAIEREVRAHLESHDVLDFVQAIRLLENELAQVDSGIRPHSQRAGAGGAPGTPRDPSHDLDRAPDWDGYGERRR